MHEQERLDRIVRRLDEASRLLVRAAAEMQAKGIDTSSLARPAVIVGEAIKELMATSPADQRTLTPLTYVPTSEPGAFQTVRPK